MELLPKEIVSIIENPSGLLDNVPGLVVGIICWGSPILFMSLFAYFKRPENNKNLFKSPESLARFRRQYNNVIAFLSASMFILCTAHWISFIRTVSTIDEYYCRREDFSSPTAYPALAGWIVFWVLKYVEWMDTLFLLIERKPVSWLSYVHHAITPSIGLSTIGQPFALSGTVTNSFAHMFMYFYYNHSKRLSRFKMYLTVIQLLQHFFMTGVTTRWILSSCFRKDEMLFGFHWSYFHMAFFVTFGYLFFVVFFLNFFVRTYVGGKSTKPKTK
jgi:hypothetical protein